MAPKLFGWFTIAFLLLSVGCGDTADDKNKESEQQGGHHKDPDVHACEHDKEGPFVEIDAKASKDDTVLGSKMHHEHIVKLTDVAGKKGGWVKLQLKADGTSTLYISTPNVKLIKADGTTEVTAKEGFPKDQTHCDGLKKKIQYAGLTAATYYLQFTDVGSDEVKYVWFNPCDFKAHGNAGEPTENKCDNVEAHHGHH